MGNTTALPRVPKYKPVGFCIYCGVSNSKLSKEHIIPFGLGGTWILPAASCEACAKITSEIERFCLRTMFGPFRIQLKLPTRRPSQRPTTLPIDFIRIDGKKERDNVAAEDHPSSCIGFRFLEPGLLRNAVEEENFDGELVMRYINDTLTSFIRPEGQRVKLGTFNMLMYSRMLAKIAHAYTVAEVGWGNFKPLLPEYILGTNTKTPYVVGGDPTSPATKLDSILHDVYLRECISGGAHYILTAIQLFAFIGMPRYHVVAGHIS